MAYGNDAVERYGPRLLDAWQKMFSEDQRQVFADWQGYYSKDTLSSIKEQVSAGSSKLVVLPSIAELTFSSCSLHSQIFVSACATNITTLRSTCGWLYEANGQTLGSYLALQAVG